MRLVRRTPLLALRHAADRETGAATRPAPQGETRRGRRVRGFPLIRPVTSGNAPTTPAADGSRERHNGPSPGHAEGVNTIKIRPQQKAVSADRRVTDGSGRISLPCDARRRAGRGVCGGRAFGVCGVWG